MKRSGPAAGAAVGFTAFVALHMNQSPVLAQAAQAGATSLPAVDVQTSQPKAARPVVRKPRPRPKPQRAAPPPAAPAPVARAEPEPATPSTARAVGVTPTPGGAGVPLDKIPGAVSGVSAADIAREPSAAAPAVLQQRVPGAIITDVQGNEFRTDLQYRGFSASPMNGTPQGLAVYQNGARVNELFGDTVNWDLIPTVAISDIALVSNNPMYGFNALGGAVNILMKDGFTYQGVEADLRLGSFGRIQESLQAGARSGAWAGYVALEGVNDDGWRDFSPSQVRRMYADLGVKSRDAEFHVNFTGGENRFGVVGPTPVELLERRDDSVFTSPQKTKDQLAATSLNGTVTVAEGVKLSGVLYYRGFRQKHVDGNVAEIEPCGDGLCLEGGEALFNARTGLPLSSDFFSNDDDIPGSIDRTQVKADGFGGSLQAASERKLFGHGNLFLIGASFDKGMVISRSTSELGLVDPSSLAVTGLGPILATEEGEISPMAVKTKTNAYGFSISDTFDVTNAFSVTAGGRYNIAHLKLTDLINPPDAEVSLNGAHTYERFNPMIGATYKLFSGLSVYGGYSEANRAPTPAELACADPDHPCLLENFLVSDPELKQVVAHTSEAGLRGAVRPRLTAGDRLDWSLGYFRTYSEDDILNVASPLTGRGYFLNAGDTLREGIEAGLTYRTARLMLYANYAYVDATFQDAMVLSSPDNPAADEEGNIHVRPGDKIPSIPAHRFKAGFDYQLTRAWKVGADLVYASDQFLRGDESNQNDTISGYAVVNLRTSYDVTKNIQLYGIVQNLFDEKYATFGAFYDTAPNDAFADLGFSNPRTITPGQPLSVYGGMKVKF